MVTFGSRVATAEATLRDAAGTLYASATSTCLIIVGRAAWLRNRAAASSPPNRTARVGT